MVNHIKSEKGQASILLGMMMLTFILFFMFVINIGMLVNAKINLQNAADLAAYAGASVQARQLNAISFLNYEMRRQYKKYIFRSYVIGNMAQKSHPTTAPNTDDVRLWSPDGGSTNYQVPATCMIFAKDNNVCQVSGGLRAIEVVAANPLDMIQSELSKQLQSLENLRQNSCKTIGKTNSIATLLWLWNTDPSLEQLQATLATADKDILAVLKTCCSGLGLIPSLLMLKQRIDTMKFYVNSPPVIDADRSKIQQLQDGADVAFNERTIQAYLSAYYTLGNHTFDDPSEIKMTEMIPSDGVVLQLQPINLSQIDAFSIDFDLVPRADASGTNKADCIPLGVHYNIAGTIPVGVYKEKKITTYYALELKAKAKILFNPFGSDITLSAFAAARPFGSRIGPELTETDFFQNIDSSSFSTSQDGGLTISGASTATSMAKFHIPNLPVRKDDSAQGGWNKLFVQYGMYKVLGDTSIESAIGNTSFQRAYQAAMAPNPYEEGKYNIPSNAAEDDFLNWSDKDKVVAFHAPLISPLQPGADKPEQIIASTVETLLKGSITGGNISSGADAWAEGIASAITGYVNDYLRVGVGPDKTDTVNEGYNVMKMSDPYFYLPNYSNPKGTEEKIAFSANDADIRLDLAKFRNSWADVKDGDMRQRGRVGYSVKLVAFPALLGMAKNPPQSADAEAQEILNLIQH